MHRNFAFIAALTALLCFVVGCQRQQTDVTRQPVGKIGVTDSTGRRVEVLAHPGRVVVLNNTAMNVICGLGAADRVVGTSEFSRERNQFLAALLGDKLNSVTSVGKFSKPSVEKILELRPDLVVDYA